MRMPLILFHTSCWLSLLISSVARDVQDIKFMSSQSTSPNLIKHIIYFNNLVAKLLEKDAIISKHLCNVQSIWLHKCRCLLCAIYRQLASPWWLIEWTILEKHQIICFIFDRIYHVCMHLRQWSYFWFFPPLLCRDDLQSPFPPRPGNVVVTMLKRKTFLQSSPDSLKTEPPTLALKTSSCRTFHGFG